MENQRLRDELTGMQQIQAEWQGRVGVEVNYVLRHMGEAARNATRVVQHEGRDMYDHQERIRRTTTEAQALMAEKRAGVEAAICVLRREEYRPLPDCAGKPVDKPIMKALRAGATWLVAAKPNADLMKHFQTASENNADSEQQLRN